jgi:hypothetical protein
MTEDRHLPEIIEDFKNFDPRCNVAKDVRRLPKSVPVENLRGIRSVVLTNYGALPRGKQRQKLWSRGRKLKMDSVGASITPTGRDSRPGSKYSSTEFKRRGPGSSAGFRSCASRFSAKFYITRSDITSISPNAPSTVRKKMLQTNGRKNCLTPTFARDCRGSPSFRLSSRTS